MPTPLRAARRRGLASELARLAPHHGFGMVHVARLTTADAAAAYCSKYPDERVSGERFLPSHSCWAARISGVTISVLRRVRQLWAVRIGVLPPPSWNGLELARVIAVAGPWSPSRAP